jgi:hypothetical protein
MKEVFIVFEQDEVDCIVVAVYDNLKAAEDFCAKMRAQYDDVHFYFERHVVNMSVIP